MELAENVGGKTLSFAKPESFDARFGDSEYLVSKGGKSRLRGYLCTFGCMICCGLLLVGGGAFFIYESVMILKKPENDKPNGPAGRMAPAPLQDEHEIEKTAGYSKEFQIVAFVFIAVGAVMFMVGVPFASRFYRRYRRTKESERSPILEATKKEKGGRIYIRRDNKGTKSERAKRTAPAKPPEPDEKASHSEMASTSDKISFLNKKTSGGKRRKSRTGWMYRSPRRISNESFRFAAHRHPSMNHIQLDGSNIFGRFENAESSPGTSSDEEPPDQSPKKNSDLHSSRNSFQGFVDKIFRRRDDQSEKLVKNEFAESANAVEDGKKPKNPQVTRSESDRIHGENSSYRETSEQSLETGEGKTETAMGQGGLYNLG